MLWRDRNNAQHNIKRTMGYDMTKERDSKTTNNTAEEQKQNIVWKRAKQNSSKNIK